MTQQMSDDGEVSDPFSRAIVGFREEVLLWIDTALARLRQAEQDEGVVTEERSEDALNRLDALARLLDRRLKLSAGAASTSAGANVEVEESNG